MQSMALKRASGAHSAYAGRSVNQNSFSGSLPAEIGQLSGLVNLYGPSLFLSARALVHSAREDRREQPFAEHGQVWSAVPPPCLVTFCKSCCSDLLVQSIA